MKRPLFAPQARLDFLELWLLISAAGGSDRADAYIRRIEAKCDLLAMSPGIGRARPAWGRGIRSLSVDNYVIVFRRVSGRVRVLRLVHGAQDLDELFGE